MNYIVQRYENSREEDRLTTIIARKVKFETTIRVFNEVVYSNKFMRR